MPLQKLRKKLYGYVGSSSGNYYTDNIIRSLLPETLNSIKRQKHIAQREFDISTTSSKTRSTSLLKTCLRSTSPALPMRSSEQMWRDEEWCERVVEFLFVSLTF